MVLALATSSASAQATPATLSLGDAARLAALQSAPVVAARHRAEQADARVTQRRADLLPNVSAWAVENGRTLNTATFGIDFPSPPGQPPVFDPDGHPWEIAHNPGWSIGADGEANLGPVA